MRLPTLLPLCGVAQTPLSSILVLESRSSDPSAPSLRSDFSFRLPLRSFFLLYNSLRGLPQHSFSLARIVFFFRGTFRLVICFFFSPLILPLSFYAPCLRLSSLRKTGSRFLWRKDGVLFFWLSTRSLFFRVKTFSLMLLPISTLFSAVGEVLFLMTGGFLCLR